MDPRGAQAGQLRAAAPAPGIRFDRVRGGADSLAPLAKFACGDFADRGFAAAGKRRDFCRLPCRHACLARLNELLAPRAVRTRALAAATTATPAAPLRAAATAAAAAAPPTAAAMPPARAVRVLVMAGRHGCLRQLPRDRRGGDLVADVLLDLRERDRVLLAGEADRVALGAGARRAADAVHIV